MDGDSPGGFERILHKDTVKRLLYLIVGTVNLVFPCIPSLLSYINAFPFAVHHHDVHLSIGRVVVDLHTFHHAYHAVIIPVPHAVVFDKHHLCPYFQFQMPLGGRCAVGEIALHHSIKDVDRRV